MTIHHDYDVQKLVQAFRKLIKAVPFNLHRPAYLDEADQALAEFEKMQTVEVTNHGWPHEKKLQDRIKELEAQLEKTKITKQRLEFPEVEFSNWFGKKHADRNPYLTLEGAARWGWNAHRDLQAQQVQRLVDAANGYLNIAPTHGWHFSDCEAHEDNYEDEMPCTCGTSFKEIELNEALKPFEKKTEGV